MADPTISNLLGLLYVTSKYSRPTDFETLLQRALAEKHLRILPPMISRLCRLGYVLKIAGKTPKDARYKITEDGRALLRCPLSERHEKFSQRKEVHPEGHKCCICGYSGPGLTRFQRRDYCMQHLNTEYKPEYTCPGGSSLSWET